VELDVYTEMDFGGEAIADGQRSNIGNCG